jgi:cephalosporin hydroxylase
MAETAQLCQGINHLGEYTFAGYGIQQSWSALFMLNRVLDESKDIQRVVELGTGSGGLAIFFGLIMHNRAGKVITIDTTMPNQATLKDFEYLNIEYLQVDVFSDKALDHIKDFIKGYRVLVLCDNGCKKKEFPLYTNIIKSNDLIMAHDWLAEIFKEDLDNETMSVLDYYHQDEFDALKTRMLSMIKK